MVDNLVRRRDPDHDLLRLQALEHQSEPLWRGGDLTRPSNKIEVVYSQVTLLLARARTHAKSGRQ